MINKDGYLSDEERETVYKKQKRNRKNRMDEPEYIIEESLSEEDFSMAGIDSSE